MNVSVSVNHGSPARCESSCCRRRRRCLSSHVYDSLGLGLDGSLFKGAVSLCLPLSLIFLNFSYSPFSSCLEQAMAAAAAALAILDGVDTNHVHDAALADVSTALREMDRAIRTFDPARPMRIYERVSMY